MIDAPTVWFNTKLEDVLLSIVGGGTPSKSVPSYFDGNIPWMTVKDMNKNILDDTVDHISQEAVDNSSTNVIPAGTPIVATRMSLGKIVVARFDSAINQDLKALFHSEYIDKDYLVYWYRSNTNLIEELGTGTTVKGIRLEVLKALNFPVSPLAEQKVIAKKLDKLLAKVDSIKARLDAVPDTLKRFRQSVLAAAVSGKLTEEWREKNDARVDFSKLDEVRSVEYEKACNEAKSSKQKKPRKPSWMDKQFSVNKEWIDLYLDTAPENWSCKNLAYVGENNADSIVDGPFGASINVKKDYIDSGVPVIRINNIKPFKFDSSETKFVSEDKFSSLKRHNIISGDILFGKVGTIGDSAIYPDSMPEGMLATTGCTRIRVDHRVCSGQYLEVYLNAMKIAFNEIASAAVQPFLNMKTIKSFPIAIPCIHEQVEIVRRVEKLFAYADKVEAEVNAAQERVNKLTQSILAKAFRGELTAKWREQNPDLISGDNSAEALLEKIKAEREKLKPKKKTRTKK